jgi:hypothetical protein
MASLSNLETRITAEWGIVRSFVALHPFIACGLSFVAGAVVKWVL